MDWPLATSHKRTVPSALALTSRSSPACEDRDTTGPECPSMMVALDPSAVPEEEEEEEAEETCCGPSEDAGREGCSQERPEEEEVRPEESMPLAREAGSKGCSCRENILPSDAPKKAVCAGHRAPPPPQR